MGSEPTAHALLQPAGLPLSKSTHVVGVCGLPQPALEALELVGSGVTQRLKRQRRQVASQAMHCAQGLWAKESGHAAPADGWAGGSSAWLRTTQTGATASTRHHALLRPPHLRRHAKAARADQGAIGLVVTLADGGRQRCARHDVGRRRVPLNARVVPGKGGRGGRKGGSAHACTLRMPACCAA